MPLRRSWVAPAVDVARPSSKPRNAPTSARRRCAAGSRASAARPCAGRGGRDRRPSRRLEAAGAAGRSAPGAMSVSQRTGRFTAASELMGQGISGAVTRASRSTGPRWRLPAACSTLVLLEHVSPPRGAPADGEDQGQQPGRRARRRRDDPDHLEADPGAADPALPRRRAATTTTWAIEHRDATDDQVTSTPPTPSSSTASASSAPPSPRTRPGSRSSA